MNGTEAVQKLEVSKEAEIKLTSCVCLPQYTEERLSTNSLLQITLIVSKFDLGIERCCKKCCLYLKKTGMPYKAVCAQQIYLSHKMPEKWWGASLSDPLGTEVEYSVSIMNRSLLGGWKIF